MLRKWFEVRFIDLERIEYVHKFKYYDDAISYARKRVNTYPFYAHCSIYSVDRGLRRYIDTIWDFSLVTY